MGRVNAWLWVFSAKDATVYIIRKSRAEEVLGDDFDGYLVVDGLKTYDSLEQYAKARCNGHLLRRCKELRATVPAKEKAQVAALSNLLKEASAT